MTKMIKILELVKEFSKIMGSSINIQISVGFLNTSSEPLQKEIKKVILVTVTTK